MVGMTDVKFLVCAFPLQSNAAGFCVKVGSLTISFKAFQLLEEWEI